MKTPIVSGGNPMPKTFSGQLSSYKHIFAIFHMHVSSGYLQRDHQITVFRSVTVIIVREQGYSHHNVHSERNGLIDCKSGHAVNRLRHSRCVDVMTPLLACCYPSLGSSTTSTSLQRSRHNLLTTTIHYKCETHNQSTHTTFSVNHSR